MIKYNSNTINDWYYNSSDIIKVYHNGAVCYYKLDSSSPSGQTPCFAVVDDITQYTETEFEDVFDKATEKWYKLNNLNEYEEYGVYASGRTSCSAVSFNELTDIIAQSTTALTNHNVTVTPAVGAFSKIRIDTTKSATTTSYTWATFTPTPNGSEVLGINMDNIGVMNGYGNSKNYVTDANGSQTFAHWVDDNNTIVEIDIAALSNNQASELYLLFYQENCNPAAFSFYIESQDCVTTYEGKLTIDDGYEYIYSGNSWVNVGEVSGSTIETIWLDPASSNAVFNIGHYWGNNYKMVFNTYLDGSYSSDVGSFWQMEGQTPIEFAFYSNGFYYDMHNPTSTSAPSVNTNDYNYRILKTSVFSNYENSQVMNITLTYGTIKVELEETGDVVLTASTGTSSQNWYNGLYQADVKLDSTNKKCHLSRIQVYNENDVLVNDIKFIKNPNVTGSQELSMYDSVIDATYDNTNSSTPVYHIVEDGTAVEYPIYYDEMQDPPNNLVFSSMTEAESYECPWVGMKATIDGSGYTFTSAYTWELIPSRLPVGYTEVEYIRQNNNYNAYINTGVIPYGTIGNSFEVIAKMKAYYRNTSCDTFLSCESINSPYFGFGYRFKCASGNEYQIFGADAATSTTVTNNSDGTFTYTCSRGNVTTTYPMPISLFCSFSNSSYTTPYRFSDIEVYSMSISVNNELVRDFVPAQRDSDSKYGLYDLVTNTFYLSPNGNDFSAGPSV